MAKKKILIVDDEGSILLLVKEILEQEGYTVTAVDNGEDALKMAKTRVHDLVVLDMMMPGMSGREVLEALRADEKTKDLKAIFLTVARFSEMGKDLLKEYDVADYINKPFENEEFISRIKKVLAKK